MFKTILLAALLTVTTACATTPRGVPQPKPQGRTISLSIENNNWQTAKVYRFYGGNRYERVLTQDGLSKSRTPKTYRMGGEDAVQFLIVLMGSGESIVTEDLHVTPGSKVTIHVGVRLVFTALTPY